ncbi:N(2)-acetyl-L-2,4-diaminobutanoate deacetylase DoeB [Pseudomonas sp. NC26]|uniref:N-alpha-acetyl diaminobutyric acid deacetylase DoeB n=1 Tax=Pseudomonas putida TaxID=303 RepID=A0A7W2KYR3_PSEPU|nr:MULTISPECIES: N(2)-acetyl-L-2,4-diaminobutanoate deacetylase DoeB [Pseudomonas]MBA6115245.1 N-alpha-acetyl diaminobutyric acid deacetylase DoeB [Pseudomonas putida]MCZ9639427.1 N(2)-acetyl-L-2,4-diaminobutanoate deacetylase DoeB [Pseudomonas putida]MEC4874627.1 N(2)-acetyl-L-2,4-diaminobutanoate deacetylase DoeB [Pseudomonas sp. NC26]QNL88508.1 N-alpha-acetyl-L-2,4-diaminobutyrate deacetylase [Pseudomonas putida]
MKPSPIKPTVDFERDGVQHGFLKLPYSRDDSAWGSIMIPVTVVKQGSGPTVLLTGGNHGDEYEGPVALTKLASTLNAEDVQGRVIIIPFMNYPAFKAGTRTSPIDHGNLNRTFPGKPDGTVTQKIADYIQRFILPMADYVLDIHSGGKTLDFVPFSAVHILADKVQQHRAEQAMRAFAAPFSMMMLEIDSVGMFDTAAEEAGKVFVTTELGGGGSSTATTIEIAERGVRNFLIHAGVTAGELGPGEACIMLDMPDGDCFITSEHAGLIELCFNLGDSVRAGDVVARVYDATRTGAPPVEYLAKRDGLLACRHFPGLVQCGDTLAVLGVVV